MTHREFIDSREAYSIEEQIEYEGQQEEDWNEFMAWLDSVERPSDDQINEWFDEAAEEAEQFFGLDL